MRSIGGDVLSRRDGSPLFNRRLLDFWFDKLRCLSECNALPEMEGSCLEKPRIRGNSPSLICPLEFFVDQDLLVSDTIVQMSLKGKGASRFEQRLAVSFTKIHRKRSATSSWNGIDLTDAESGDNYKGLFGYMHGRFWYYGTIFCNLRLNNGNVS
ncbi:hypothetical protein BO70DRAFT_143984 [Aspergillus heteromorphus CBS 117.55]|uniref:Uncharacterized protein n=1 Tax=Aspergillus heteromorphus CBS 117.55 TaxID=1448321 RepID=A0A317V7F3_9EURO|nr:uncharacterized protein BO70DRAFT_143984 [Aspergillus heteromorphus CBS 117.55]PWY70283.1 hypothetical protein BO70DRAFT_143984 [Aspergillus heteromorphus CBS 117.55]